MNKRISKMMYQETKRTGRPVRFLYAVFSNTVHGNQFSNYENYAILKGMDRTTLTDFFEEVETTEEYNGYFCSISEAISIVVLGSLCGFKNVSQIHQWAESAHAREFLKEKFGIKHVPCYYWLLVLLKMVKPDTLNTCLMKWAAQYLPADRSQTTISLDGKTIRSTTGMKNIERPMHIISAQICELGVTLASETVDEKSNEIPAVQELLKKLSMMQTAMQQSVQKTLKLSRQRLNSLAEKRVLQSPLNYVEDRRVLLDFLSTRLHAAGQKALHEKKQRFVRLTAALDAMSPLKVLSRGYSMVTDETGTLVTSAGAVTTGQRIHVSLRSGSLTAQVEQIQEEDKNV